MEVTCMTSLLKVSAKEVPSLPGPVAAVDPPLTLLRLLGGGRPLVIFVDCGVVFCRVDAATCI